MGAINEAFDSIGENKTFDYEGFKRELEELYDIDWSLRDGAQAAVDTEKAHTKMCLDEYRRWRDCPQRLVDENLALVRQARSAKDVWGEYVRGWYARKNALLTRWELIPHDEDGFYNVIGEFDRRQHPDANVY